MAEIQPLKRYFFVKIVIFLSITVKNPSFSACNGSIFIVEKNTFVKFFLIN